MRSLELRIPPPVVLAAAAFSMWLIAEAFPELRVDLPARGIFAAVLGGCGVLWDVLAVLAFLRVRTTVNPMNPGASTALVTGSVYRLSRNPMYVGQLILLCAWAAFLANPATLLVAPIFVWYVTRFQVVPEERVLRAKFPAEFDAYCRRVRRWL